jgi:hypothetical protein
MRRLRRPASSARGPNERHPDARSKHNKGCTGTWFLAAPRLFSNGRIVPLQCSSRAVGLRGLRENSSSTTCVVPSRQLNRDVRMQAEAVDGGTPRTMHHVRALRINLVANPSHTDLSGHRSIEAWTLLRIEQATDMRREMARSYLRAAGIGVRSSGVGPTIGYPTSHKSRLSRLADGVGPREECLPSNSVWNPNHHLGSNHHDDHE